MIKKQINKELLIIKIGVPEIQQKRTPALILEESLLYA